VGWFNEASEQNRRKKQHDKHNAKKNDDDDRVLFSFLGFNFGSSLRLERNNLEPRFFGCEIRL
jgi:hypothetical protein